VDAPDIPRLRRWLAAIETPDPFCHFCLKPANEPAGHDRCVCRWAGYLRTAYPFEQFGPDDDYEDRPAGLPCQVVTREARVNVLAGRYHRRESLWQGEDLCCMPDLDGLALEVSRLGNGTIEEGEVRCG
jgi:hypothetical protein